MKKITSIILLTVFGILPSSAHAVVNSINGLTDAGQLLVSPGSNAVNSMHMDIIQFGTDTHRFRWDGSPWRVNQGGTGLLTPPSLGQLLVGDGLDGYALMATSTLGLVPYSGATEDVNLGDHTLILNGAPLISAGGMVFNGDLIFGGSSLNLRDELNGFEMHVAIPSPNAITFFGDNVGTTTVTFGLIGQSDKTCFNTKNTDGNDISFYFVGISMVIENNLCR